MAGRRAQGTRAVREIVRQRTVEAALNNISGRHLTCPSASRACFVGGISSAFDIPKPSAQCCALTQSRLSPFPSSGAGGGPRPRGVGLGGEQQRGGRGGGAGAAGEAGAGRRGRSSWRGGGRGAETQRAGHGARDRGGKCMTGHWTQGRLAQPDVTRLTAGMGTLRRVMSVHA